MVRYGIIAKLSNRLLTGGDEEAVSEPGLEESVLLGLVNVDVAGEDDLNVTGVNQEDDQLGADPHLDHLVELE